MTYERTPITLSPEEMESIKTNLTALDTAISKYAGGFFFHFTKNMNELNYFIIELKWNARECFLRIDESFQFIGE